MLPISPGWQHARSPSRGGTTEAQLIHGWPLGIALKPVPACTLPCHGAETPAAEMVGADGESVFRVHGADRYKSAAIVDTEGRFAGAAAHTRPLSACLVRRLRRRARRA
jgi:hypothetical protein